MAISATNFISSTYEKYADDNYAMNVTHPSLLELPRSISRTRTKQFTNSTNDLVSTVPPPAGRFYYYTIYNILHTYARFITNTYTAIIPYNIEP